MRKHFIVLLSIGALFSHEVSVAGIRSLYKGLKEKAESKLFDKYIKDLPAVVNNPYKNTPVTVTPGVHISSNELDFLKKRMPKIQRALEKFLGESVPGVQPQISIVASGGGYRALIASLAFCNALNEIGLFDCVTRIAGLSGSTWMMAPWYVSGKSFSEYSKAVGEKLDWRKREITKHEVKLIEQALLTKIGYEQPITLVDVYGLFLGTSLLRDFGDKRHRVYLSDQRKMVETGDVPFPLYSGVRAEMGAVAQFYEFNPYEVGGVWLGSYCPTWAVGRYFENGSSLDFAPEQPLSFYMGLFGSAIGANIKDILNHTIDGSESMEIKFLLGTMLKTIDTTAPFVGGVRLTKAKLNNFSYKLQGSPLYYEEEFRIVDAGAKPGFNLPYPLVSEERPGRRSDIIIFCDASADQEIGKALYASEEYARSHKLKFPKLPAQLDDKKAFHLFYDETDMTVPIVLYFPLVNDPYVENVVKNNSGFEKYRSYFQNFDIRKCIINSFCSTSNFQYAQNEFNHMLGFVEANVLAYTSAIKDGIRLYKKRAFSGRR